MITAIVTAITTILGFVSSFVPALINAYTRKQDQAHERAMADKQLEAQKVGGQITLATEVARADTAQQEQLYRYASAPSGNSRVDALNSLVRPYISMVFFHVWLGVKTTALVVGIMTGMEIMALVSLVWDDPTVAIFGAIMGFWFGNRAVQRNIDPSYAAMPTVKPVDFKTAR
jgi:uncharacterized protein YbjQ (UPF0145 family)